MNKLQTKVIIILLGLITITSSYPIVKDITIAVQYNRMMDAKIDSIRYVVYRDMNKPIEMKFLIPNTIDSTKIHLPIN